MPEMLAVLGLAMFGLSLVLLVLWYRPHPSAASSAPKASRGGGATPVSGVGALQSKTSTPASMSFYLGVAAQIRAGKVPEGLDEAPFKYLFPSPKKCPHRQGAVKVWALADAEKYLASDAELAEVIRQRQLCLTCLKGLAGIVEKLRTYYPPKEEKAAAEPTKPSGEAAIKEEPQKAEAEEKDEGSRERKRTGGLQIVGLLLLLPVMGLVCSLWGGAVEAGTRGDLSSADLVFSGLMLTVLSLLAVYFLFWRALRVS